MSLLLDALKRAEDAKRAKAEAVSAAAAPTTASASDAAGFVADSSVQPDASSHVLADFPVLTLERIDIRPPDPVATSNLNPASFAPAHTDHRPVGLPSANELTLADLLQAELVPAPTGAVVADAPAKSRATAAFRAARSVAGQPGTVATPNASVAPLPLEAEQQYPDAAALATINAQRDAVKNVFAVKQAKQQDAKSKWAAPIVAISIVGMGAGGWYVWNEINKFSRPAPATPQIHPAIAVAPPAPAIPAASPTTGQPAGAPTKSAVSADAVKPVPTDSSNVSQTEVPPTLPPLLPPPAAAISLPVLATGTVSRSTAPLTAREALAQKIESLPAAQDAGTQAVQLRPATRPSALALNPALAAGYTALTAGDYAAAKRHYAEALAADTTNIDANLGFASAAARTGENAMAERYYRRVLDIDPRNVTAATALLTLASNNNSLSQSTNLEGELKRLVALDPTVAASHFTLGNVYAAQRRWSEAQPAYFEAARLAPQNPDYAYNLAVSLDQLGQTKSALEFYRRALAAKEQAQFDRAVVERRLQTLATPGTNP